MGAIGAGEPYEPVWSDQDEHASTALRGTRIGGQAAVELLLDAGAVLASSLDLQTTIAQIARLTVPRLADLCVVDMLEPDGSIRKVAVAAEDEALALELEDVRRRHPLDERGEHPVAQVIRDGEPRLLEEMSTSTLERIAQGAEHARFMIGNGYRSAIVAPLLARGRTLGALSLLRLGDCELYDDDDLALGSELARRAALAIDNAALFSNLRSVEQRLEAILANLAEAIVVEDADGHTVFANHAAAELLGVASAAELTNVPRDAIAARFLLLDEQGRQLGTQSMPARRLFAGEQPGPLLIRSILRSTGEERWLVARASPIADPPSGRMLYAVTVLENITGVKRAQLAETFMAEASRMLASSLDYGETLQRVAQLAVPQIADLCAVDVIDERGELQRVGVHHADPGRLALARQLGDLYRPSLEDVHGVGEVIRSGEPSLIDDIAPGARAARGRDERHLQMLRGLGATGAIIVPLAAPTRTIGAMTLVSAESLRRLDEADVALAVRLGRRAGTAIERARLYTERTRITRILEAALLPQTLPQVPGVEIEALYRAAGELNDVGGDFYDVLHYGERRWMLVIGDVCGKGPHAAGVTALARHTLRTAAMLGQPPAGMLHTLHQALASQPGGAELCTVCLVTIEPLPVGARLTVALAGHPPPLVIDREGATRHIGRPGTLLGMIDPVSVHEVDAHLDAGETLLLYTDGLLDAADAERTEESFALVLGEEAAATPLDELLRRLVQTASVRSGPRMRDDVALLAARPPTAGATARL